MCGDVITIAYDALSGRRLWTSTFDGRIHGEDVGEDILTSPDGRLVLAPDSHKPPPYIHVEGPGISSRTGSACLETCVAVLRGCPRRLMLRSIRVGESPDARSVSSGHPKI